MWPVEYTQEYEDWFSVQEEDNKMAINAKVILLAEELITKYPEILEEEDA